MTLGNLGSPLNFRRIPDEYEKEPPEEWLPAMPAGCLRCQSIPKLECRIDCEGRQADGSCLLDLIKGKDQWHFEVDVRTGRWELVGADAPGA